MQIEELSAYLEIALLSEVNYSNFKKLLDVFSDTTSISNQSYSSLTKVVSPTCARAITERYAKNSVQQALSWLDKDNHYILTINDELYPPILLNIHDPPLVLYAYGDISLLNNNKIAVVGTRHPTQHGTNNAFKFANNLSKHNITVVSGVAYGIDRFAHLGAVTESGSTIGVIGTGIDVRYPKSNTDVYQQIVEHGLLLTEFVHGTAPLAMNFPKRNRIIAGLSSACLVIESAISGGSMITANYAVDMGRDVMAIPGSIHSPMSAGCHKLIKNGAKLVENINDILDELVIDKINAHSSDNQILSIMGFNPISLDAICNKLNVQFNDICHKILELELNGMIINCGGGCYQRVGLV